MTKAEMLITFPLYEAYSSQHEDFICFKFISMKYFWPLKFNQYIQTLIQIIYNPRFILYFFKQP